MHKEILFPSGTGRRKIVRTAHGTLETPFFMPDATMAAVRGIEPQAIHEAGIEAIVVNTYHLFLRPGASRIAHFGGVHEFMKWHRPILSDSGGYQVYSLIHKHPDSGNVSEEGAVFRSPLDGSTKLLTPEHSIDIQFELGVDMMVCLDDPRPNDTSRDDLARAVDRTIRWAARCKARFEERLTKHPQKIRPLLFGVIQGGMEADLRARCAEALVDIGFDGYGFGARHLDMEGNFLEDIVRETAKSIPDSSLRFALGIGTPSDIVRSFALGWDMFDCVIPTREGRHGRAFLRNRGVPISGDFYHAENISAERFSEDRSPLDPFCGCLACSAGFSRGYIRHLLVGKEPLGARLLAIHNLFFYADLLRELKTSIEAS